MIAQNPVDGCAPRLTAGRGMLDGADPVHQRESRIDSGAGQVGHASDAAINQSRDAACSSFPARSEARMPGDVAVHGFHHPDQANHAVEGKSAHATQMGTMKLRPITHNALPLPQVITALTPKWDDAVSQGWPTPHKCSSDLRCEFVVHERLFNDPFLVNISECRFVRIAGYK